MAAGNLNIGQEKPIIIKRGEKGDRITLQQYIRVIPHSNELSELERALQQMLPQIWLPVIARDWTNGTGTHTTIHRDALACERFYQAPDLLHQPGEPYLGEVGVRTYVQLIETGFDGMPVDTKQVKRIE